MHLSKTAQNAQKLGLIGVNAVLLLKLFTQSVVLYALVLNKAEHSTQLTHKRT